MPSPFLIAAFVVKGNTLPQPPVQRMTARAVIASMRPDFRSMATTPCDAAIVDQEPGDEPLVVANDAGDI